MNRVLGYKSQPLCLMLWALSFQELTLHLAVGVLRPICDNVLIIDLKWILNQMKKKNNHLKQYSVWYSYALFWPFYSIIQTGYLKAMTTMSFQCGNKVSQGKVLLSPYWMMVGIETSFQNSQINETSPWTNNLHKICIHGLDNLFEQGFQFCKYIKL